MDCRLNCRQFVVLVFFLLNLNYLYFLPQPEDHQPLLLNLQWNFENFLDYPLQNLR